VIEFEINERDFLSASLFASRRRRGLLWFQIANSIIFFSVGVFLSFSSAAPKELKPVGVMAFSFVAFLWLVFFLSRHLLMPRQARKRFGTNKMLSGSRTVSWDSDAVTVKTQYGTNTVPWTVFSEYAENESVILLYTSPRLTMFVPKRALSESQASELKKAYHAAKAQPSVQADRP
jgi:hypothetical protein